MLLLKGDSAWPEYASRPGFALVILLASSNQDDAQLNRTRLHYLALTGRIAKLGVCVLECSNGDFFVAYHDTESQVIGLARQLLRERRTAENWFLRRSDVGEPLLQELPDRTLHLATVTGAGFKVADGRVFQPEGVYHPAQNSTSNAHSLGYDVGDHICERPRCRSLEKFRKRQFVQRWHW